MRNIALLLLDREKNQSSFRGRRLGFEQSAAGCWAEADFLRHSSSEYVEFRPSPRSSIAAAFSPNGRYLASTHGDHTVKVTDVASGKVLHSLVGHRRTPWVVRFSPVDLDVMASGSLDFTAIVWQVSTGKLLHKYDFGKPIASLAFDPSGMLLVVSAGHKVFCWPFTRGEAPVKILKTRRSLRALHFHPTAPHILLTAEVTERRAAVGPAQEASAFTTTTAAPGGRAPPQGAAAQLSPLVAPQMLLHQQRQQQLHQELQQASRRLDWGRQLTLQQMHQRAQETLQQSQELQHLENEMLGIFQQDRHQGMLRGPQEQQQQADSQMAVGIHGVGYHHGNENRGSGQGGGGLPRAGRTAAATVGRAIGGEQAGGAPLDFADPQEAVDDLAAFIAAHNGVGTASAMHPPTHQLQEQAADVEPRASSVHDPPNRTHHQSLTGAAVWPMGLLRNLLTGVTGVFTGGLGGSTAAGGGGSGTRPPSPPQQRATESALARAIRAAASYTSYGGNEATAAGGGGDGGGGGGAPSVNPIRGGVWRHSHPTRSWLPRNIVSHSGASRTAARGGLNVLSPADVIRFQSLGGGVSHAMPLVTPLEAVAMPPPFVREARGGVEAAPPAPPDHPHVAPYDLLWGWDRTQDLSETELARSRELAIRAAPDLPSAANHDTPCIVTVRLWDFRDPFRELRKELLVLPRVVLCSEMGIHFSSCGRYMVCCMVREEPSEASTRWQVAQVEAAQAAQAAAVSETHVCAHPVVEITGLAAVTGKQHCGGVESDDDDNDNDGELEEAVDGGELDEEAEATHAAGTAMVEATGHPTAVGRPTPGSPSSCRSVEMADAEAPSRNAAQLAIEDEGAWTVAWLGGGGRHGGVGDEYDDENLYDTATQAFGVGAEGHGRAFSLQPAATSTRWRGRVRRGLGASDEGSDDDEDAPALSALSLQQQQQQQALPQRLRPRHGEEDMAEARTQMSRPGAAVHWEAEYDSATATANHRPTAAASAVSGVLCDLDGEVNCGGDDSEDRIKPDLNRPGCYSRGLARISCSLQDPGSRIQDPHVYLRRSHHRKRQGWSGDGDVSVAAPANDLAASRVVMGANDPQLSRPQRHGHVAAAAGAGVVAVSGAVAGGGSGGAGGDGTHQTGGGGAPQHPHTQRNQQLHEHHQHHHHQQQLQHLRSHNHHNHPQQSTLQQQQQQHKRQQAPHTRLKARGPSQMGPEGADGRTRGGAGGMSRVGGLPLRSATDTMVESTGRGGNGGPVYDSGALPASFSVAPAAVQHTPSTFASIKAHLAQQRSRDGVTVATAVGTYGIVGGAGADCAGGTVCGPEVTHAAAAAAVGTSMAVVEVPQEAEGFDAGGGAAATGTTTFAAPAVAAAGRHAGGSGALPRNNVVTVAPLLSARAAAAGGGAVTAAAVNPQSGGSNRPCYELCIFYTGTSPLALPMRTDVCPTAFSFSASGPTLMSLPPSTSSSVAFPAAPGARGLAAVAASAAPAADAGGGGTSAPLSSSSATIGPHFGSLLHARPVLAAHCMTSVQLSPAGDHVLVAYGRRHISLCSLVSYEGQLAAVHSVVEIYSVPDLKLRRVLLSADDEVNVAVFNAFPAEGLAYGTKEGRLRLLRYDRRPPLRSAIPFMPPPTQVDDDSLQSRHHHPQPEQQQEAARNGHTPMLISDGEAN